MPVATMLRLVCALGLCAAVTRPAYGQPAEQTANAEQPTNAERSVTLIEVGATPSFFDLLTLLTPSQFHPIALTIQQTSAALKRQSRASIALEDIIAPSAVEVDARIFISVEPQRALLVVVDDRRDRLHIRVLPRDPDQDDVLVEELAEVAGSSLEALFGGGSFGQARRAGLARLELLPRRRKI